MFEACKTVVGEYQYVDVGRLEKKYLEFAKAKVLTSRLWLGFAAFHVFEHPAEGREQYNESISSAS